MGRKLLTRISDVMHSRALPFCAHDSRFREVIQVITRGRLGLAIVMDRGKLCGVITDGDIRRAFENESASSAFTAADIMTKTPKTIKQSERLVVAEELMREEKIKELIVVDDDEQVAGVLQIFDLDQAESGQ
ncbi:Arabinose 5-phosphate isomerase KpsF [compost metagenome]